MTHVGAVSPASGPAAPSSASQASASAALSLLPDAPPGALAGADPLSVLYLVDARDRDLGVDEGTHRIASLQSERDQSVKQELQAIQQEDDAARDHGFWSDVANICGEVAKVAAVVASIAVSVATAGAGTPIAVLAVAGAALSTASFVDGELHVLRSLGVDASTAGFVDLAMGLGGALASGGAGALAGGQATATSLVGTASAVVSGVGRMGAGAAEVAAAQAQQGADTAAADEAAALARSGHLQRLEANATDDTESSDRQAEGTLATIAGIDAIRRQTAVDAATAVRG